jgi:replication factor A1
MRFTISTRRLRFKHIRYRISLRGGGMSALQAIMDEIHNKRPDLSADQIRSLIEEKKRELPGFLSDEGAARLVAEELLVKTRGTELGRMQVKDLVSGLNDVTLSGRVLTVSPIQNFQRRDGTPGKVMRLTIVDRTGRVRCVLWDRHAEIVSKARDLQGRIVTIGHAYTRQGLAGDTEVHAGDRSSIETNPQGMAATDFPEFSELFTPIADIQNESNNANVVGVIQLDPRYHSFRKEDRVGAVLRSILADQSGRIPFVAWNEKAEELRDIKKGTILQIVNARTRLDSNSRPELHAETRSQITVLQEPPAFLKFPNEENYAIAELTARSSYVDLIVLVVAKGDSREVKRTTGETLKVSPILVGDETGILRLSLWDDKADLANDLREGDTLHLRGVSVRDRLGELQLSLGRSGEIEKLTVAKALVEAKKLNTLTSAKGLVIVEGTISDQPLIRQVTTGKGETIRVASFTFKDETGSARVTFWRDQVNLVEGLRPNVRLRITGARVQSALNGGIELSSIPLTKINKIDPARELNKEEP